MNMLIMERLVELDTKSRSKVRPIYIGIFATLTVVGIWDLFVFRDGITRAIAVLGLTAEICVMIWWMTKRQQQKSVTVRSTKHYLTRLYGTDSLQERQAIIDDMVALDLLTNISMSGLDLSDLDLTHAKLDKSDLSLAKFKGVQLSETSMRGVNLSYASLLYSTVRNVNLQNANLDGASFRSSDLSGSKLSGANLRAASLNDCNLTGVDLRAANLRHADLRNATLTDAVLTNADLRHCILPDGSIWSPETNMRQFTQRDQALVELFFSKTPIQKLFNINRK
ncbi:MAG: pentapeptide repeat-containing protein [Chloroflexi bacterium]|nr:pentapeptide repeat-containing protein [Chloroflexota bacterium]MBK9747020.1 pentapeptide repeat-containing protein [Chloroflexota bacterium]